MHAVDGAFQVDECAANGGGDRCVDVRMCIQGSKRSSSSSSGMMVAGGAFFLLRRRQVCIVCILPELELLSSLHWCQSFLALTSFCWTVTACQSHSSLNAGLVVIFSSSHPPLFDWATGHVVVDVCQTLSLTHCLPLLLKRLNKRF